MLKILQARLQQYVNWEFPYIKVGFRKGRGTRDQITNIHWIRESKRIPEKHLLLFYWLCKKPLTLWIITNCGKFWKRWECWTTLPISWETFMQEKKQQLELEHGTMDWFKIGKVVCQGYVLSPCLFNLHTEYIMWNAGLDESQIGIKVAGRNINNLRYADDTIPMAENEEELKNLLMEVKKQSGKAGLTLNIKKNRSWHLVSSLHGK